MVLPESTFGQTNETPFNSKQTLAHLLQGWGGPNIAVPLFREKASSLPTNEGVIFGHPTYKCKPIDVVRILDRIALGELGYEGSTEGHYGNVKPEQELAILQMASAVGLATLPADLIKKRSGELIKAIGENNSHRQTYFPQGEKLLSNRFSSTLGLKDVSLKDRFSSWFNNRKERQTNLTTLDDLVETLKSRYQFDKSLFPGGQERFQQDLSVFDPELWSKVVVERPIEEIRQTQNPNAKLFLRGGREIMLSSDIKLPEKPDQRVNLETALYALSVARTKLEVALEVAPQAYALLEVNARFALKEIRDMQKALLETPPHKQNNTFSLSEFSQKIKERARSTKFAFATYSLLTPIFILSAIRCSPQPPDTSENGPRVTEVVNIPGSGGETGTGDEVEDQNKVVITEEIALDYFDNFSSYSYTNRDWSLISSIDLARGKDGSLTIAHPVIDKEVKTGLDIVKGSATFQAKEDGEGVITQKRNLLAVEGKDGNIHSYILLFDKDQSTISSDRAVLRYRLGIFVEDEKILIEIKGGWYTEELKAGEDGKAQLVKASITDLEIDLIADIVEESGVGEPTLEPTPPASFADGSFDDIVQSITGAEEVLAAPPETEEAVQPTEEERIEILKKAGMSQEDWESQAEEKLGPLKDDVIWPLVIKPVGLNKPTELVGIDLVQDSDLPFGENIHGGLPNIWRVTGVVGDEPMIDQATGEVFLTIKTLNSSGEVVVVRLSLWKPDVISIPERRVNRGNVGEQFGLLVGFLNLTDEVSPNAIKTFFEIEEAVKKGSMIQVWIPVEGHGLPVWDHDEAVSQCSQVFDDPSICIEANTQFAEAMGKYGQNNTKMIDSLQSGDPIAPDKTAFPSFIIYSETW